MRPNGRIWVWQLWRYAKSRGTFYVQLEDDVLTKKGFVSIMKHFALEKIADKQSWSVWSFYKKEVEDDNPLRLRFVIDFCQLGFIGKMFKAVELPWLVQFFLMFYNDKPGNWILHTLSCHHNMGSKIFISCWAQGYHMIITSISRLVSKCIF